MAELNEQLEQAAVDALLEVERCEMEMEQLAYPYEEQLRALTAQRDAAVAGAKYTADLARESAKQTVLALGHTVTGNAWQCVYSKGRTGWNSAGLVALANVYPAILTQQTLGEPYVTFRRRDV
jgi:hypothetical protein